MNERRNKISNILLCVEVWNIGKLFHKVTSTVHVRKNLYTP